MVKVITYGTYDLLHYGHMRLLERAKQLGDYLIVGVTADDFDITRGKINVEQSLAERIENVKSTGLADEIIVEEYEGQKIDDILKYDIDIFTVGSDWEGYFDYLDKYCKVVYLPRTKGISSSDIRAENNNLKINVIGNTVIANKFVKESSFVNGVETSQACKADAVYIASGPSEHYSQIKEALNENKHVLCESPIGLNRVECKELYEIAREKGLVLMEGIKTAYSNAFYRLMLLVESGKIGKVLSVDVTCTSMKNYGNEQENVWNSICAWGPTGMLPIFKLLGTKYLYKNISTWLIDEEKMFDGFTKVDFIFENATASMKVAKAAKSEGELIITGTKGYIYVPAPWWKTDYFEVRYENPIDNKRYFYQLDGEGIRYEIVAFKNAIKNNKNSIHINEDISCTICEIISDFFAGNVTKII